MVVGGVGGWEVARFCLQTCQVTLIQGPFSSIVDGYSLTALYQKLKKPWQDFPNHTSKVRGLTWFHGRFFVFCGN